VTIAALGWRGGDRLILTADAGVMFARRDPDGMVTVPTRLNRTLWVVKYPCICR
jgi:hypothetical protein